MLEQRARWIAVGNTATGFLAFGNVVTGVIAIGNVARGVIAIGNVAVGVIAIGNVGIGILGGFGATVALGLVSGAGVVAGPVLAGGAGVVSFTEGAPLAGVLVLFGWLLASYAMPGRRAALPPGPALTPLDELQRGERREGWIAGRARRAGEAAVRIEQRGGGVDLAVGREVLPVLAALEGRRVLALVRVEERIAPHEGGYRAAGQREQELTCAALARAPAREPPWASAGEVQWWLARAFRAGAVIGAIGLGIKLLFGWPPG